VALPINIC